MVYKCKYKLYGDDSRECDICLYWYFLDKDLKSQPNVCNECCDLQMIYIKLNRIAILNIQVVDYHCIINSNYSQKVSPQIYCKMGRKIITFSNIDVEKVFTSTRTPILIYDVKIDRTVVPNRFLLVKKVLSIFLVTKMVKKLDR